MVTELATGVYHLHGQVLRLDHPARPVLTAGAPNLFIELARASLAPNRIKLAALLSALRVLSRKLITVVRISHSL